MFPQPLQSQSDYSEALLFFEKLLREGTQCRLEDEYPLVFREDRFNRLFLMRQNGELQSGLACLERVIDVRPGQKAKALFVGSVVTDPKARRQGYQRQLFHSLEEYAEKWQIDFIVLWSNQVDFYEKLGFSLGGLQASWFIDHRAAFGAEPSRAKICLSKEIEFRREYFDSFDSKILRVGRTFDEMKLLWKIPSMTVAYTDRAYALIGKGEDFHGVCHEWAGPAAEVIECFKALSQQYGQLRILSPGVANHPDEIEVMNSLETAASDSRLEYLGLFKLMSPDFKIEGFNPETLDYPFFIWGLDSI